MDCGAEGELVAAVEEGEVEGDAWGKGCFADAEEETDYQHLSEGGCEGLEGGEETPGEDADGDVDVGGDDVVAGLDVSEWPVICEERSANSRHELTA